MPPTEDELPSRWQWLDSWFAPRWRALLTWMALAWVGRATWNYFGSNAIGVVMDRYIHWFASLTHISVPGITYGAGGVAGFVNYDLVCSWFQPLALRLNFARGAAWLGLRIASQILYVYLWYRIQYLAVMVLWVTLGLFAIPVLRGWRTRPWMALPAAMLSLGVIQLGMNSPHNWYEEWNHAILLPYAATLLYGTRLLTPEERLRARSCAREEMPEAAV